MRAEPGADRCPVGHTCISHSHGFLSSQTKLIVIIDEIVNYDYIVFMSLAPHFEALIPQGLSIGSETQPRRFMEDTAMGY